MPMATILNRDLRGKSFVNDPGQGKAHVSGTLNTYKAKTTRYVPDHLYRLWLSSGAIIPAAPRSRSHGYR